jgi:hypothetical protein
MVDQREGLPLIRRLRLSVAELLTAPYVINALVVALLNPLHRVQCLMQSAGGLLRSGAVIPKYRHSLAALRDVVRADGPTGIFRGTDVSILTSLVGTFSAMHVMPGAPAAVAPVISQEGTVLLTTALCYPLLYARTRVYNELAPASHPRPGNFWAVLRHSMQADGVRGIFRGCGPALIHETGLASLMVLSLGGSAADGSNPLFRHYERIFPLLFVLYPFSTLQRRMVMSNDVFPHTRNMLTVTKELAARRQLHHLWRGFPLFALRWSIFLTLPQAIWQQYTSIRLQS